MTREELLTEISIIKHRLACQAMGVTTQQGLLVALIALYDTLVRLDSASLEGGQQTSWRSPIRRSNVSSASCVMSGSELAQERKAA